MRRIKNSLQTSHIKKLSLYQLARRLLIKIVYDIRELKLVLNPLYNRVLYLQQT